MSLKAEGHINKVTFNNGQTMEINKNDIVIFAGPNNAGKSQSLKDIYDLTSGQIATTVIKSIEISKSSTDEIISYLSRISMYNERDRVYSGVGYSWHESRKRSLDEPNSFSGLRDVFVSYLDTENRLKICTPAQAINRDQSPNHPIHFAARETKYRKILSKNFKKAFGVGLTPHTQFGQSVPLCMGEITTLEGTFEDKTAEIEAFAQKLSTYKQVQNQGDGIRSFTGVLLNLIIDRYCMYIIDEPESFLHPPQASIMGRMIGELLNDEQQAFIATHSQDVIKGLLDVCPDRVKIVRITRDEDTNSFSILENTKFSEIWKDPLLKHSQIMESLFASSTILCESDSDCKMYSIILSHLKQKDGKYHEAHFVHCGGKHRMAKVIPALKSLNVDFRVVPDCDVLNDATVLKGIIETCGGDWNNFKRDYNVISDGLNGGRNQINRLYFKRFINELLDKTTATHLTKDEIKEINSQIKLTTKWSHMKSVGFSAIPAGNATTSFSSLNNELKKLDIYIVPCGELEQFVKEVGGHGPDWVNNVLEKFKDFDSEIYKSIREFVASWKI
jgi:Fe-S cluster assembly ATPase SufC